ncbi:MAG: hypothetical protein E6G39_19965 [Actinobacteria bacterium]|nr:MAG: hypothetical protein E6G39_19965 [Actinomycetota bacterium]
MNVLMESLGDPVWQIGGGIILLAALVLILALRSPEVHLAPQHQWFLTRLLLLVCFSCFLVLSAGVLLFHGATAAPAVTQPTSATAASHGGISLAPVPSPSPTPMPSPSPTPFPALTPSPAQVLTTFCDAINQQDLNTAWGQYAKALQQKRATPPPYQVRITMVHCQVEQVSDTSAIGYLFLKTVGPNGYTDDVERLFQFTLSVEEREWKIAQTARCLADGCLDDTTSLVP